MDDNQLMSGIQQLAGSIGQSRAAVEAIRAVEQLQARPELKMEVIAGIVERAERTREEGMRQLTTMMAAVVEMQSQQQQKQQPQKK